MSNHFVGSGNLGQVPELRHVGKNNEPVCDLRVRFDEFQPDPERPGEFKESGGFWMDCVLWGDRAERAARLLKKGARVLVEGSLRHKTWTDKEGNDRAEFYIQADDVSLKLARVEAVTMRPRAESQPGPENGKD